MSRALLVGMDASLSDALRGASGPRGVTLEPVASLEAAVEQFGREEGCDALVIGPLADKPLSLAQQVYQRDRDLAVLILTPPEKLEALRATLSYTPFIGRQTRLHAVGARDGLATALEQAIAETHQRRAHRRMLNAVSSRMSTSPALRPRVATVLDRLLELAPVGVLALNAEGHVLVSNPAAQRMLGEVAARLAEGPLASLLPEETREPLRQLLAQASATDAPVKGLLERGKGATAQSLEAMLAPLAVHEGERGFLLILQDTTERVRQERERERLLKELEAAVRMRDEFLTVASHELRTPLTSMLGWIQLLRSRGLSPEKQERALETVERNARAQAQLIEDLLDVSRIVTGKLRLEVVSFGLEDTVRQAVQSVLPAAEAKGLQVHMLLDGSLGPVLGDPHRLQQVVWNLLSNAVKFTPKGGRIHVTLRRVGSSAELVVRDTGKGIEPSFLPFVFERFRQEDSSTTRAHGGLGLGLSIVRYLVELHGGTVEVFSEGEGQGATFTVRLPISPLRTTRAAPREVTEGPGFDCPPGLEGTRVLLVEDEPDVRELMVAVLERCGVKVTATASAEEGLRALQREKPDVLISDIGMPHEDGYTLIRKVRALPPEQGGKVPALAVTAHARAEDRRRALLAGFQMHLGKPVPPDELLLMVATLATRF
jgi:PAS domain S-box-containing protein